MNGKAKKTDTLVLFTRYPMVGNTKTRLIPALGGIGAAELQREMTEYALKQVARLDARIQIFFSGGTTLEMQSWLGYQYEYVEQVEGDIGQRMHFAFKNAFDGGANRVVLLGTDCPDNRTANILECFESLEEYPCVIGPSKDGGYYMIGLTQDMPELFKGINWSTNSVFEETTARLDSYSTLDTLEDVDEIENLPRKISVIIPALDEEDNIVRSIDSVKNAFNTECIIVDGGSVDDTVRKAKEAGSKVIIHSGGRARQMNHGASFASGDILLFLHADSELPECWDIMVRDSLQDRRVLLGCFGLKVRERIPWISVIEQLVWVRSKLFKRPYGDQALFVEQTFFDESGGYQDVPILEDVFLVKAARMSGRLVQVRGDVLTSGRRWQKLGVLKTTLFNQAVLIAAAFGVDLGQLSKDYRSGKNPLISLFRRH